MKTILHKNFEKQYIKVSPKIKKKFKERRDIFFSNEFNMLLNNHPLQSKYKGYRSINITGDFRVVYKRIRRDVVIFIAIDRHSNLYS